MAITFTILPVLLSDFIAFSAASFSMVAGTCKLVICAFDTLVLVEMGFPFLTSVGLKMGLLGTLDFMGVPFGIRILTGTLDGSFLRTTFLFFIGRGRPFITGGCLKILRFGALLIFLLERLASLLDFLRCLLIFLRPRLKLS